MEKYKLLHNIKGIPFHFHTKTPDTWANSDDLSIAGNHEIALEMP
jgi:hypothetical protein